MGPVLFRPCVSLIGTNATVTRERDAIEEPLVALIVPVNPAAVNQTSPGEGRDA